MCYENNLQIRLSHNESLFYKNIAIYPYVQVQAIQNNYIRERFASLTVQKHYTEYSS